MYNVNVAMRVCVWKWLISFPSHQSFTVYKPNMLMHTNICSHIWHFIDSSMEYANRKWKRLTSHWITERKHQVVVYRLSFERTNEVNKITFGFKIFIVPLHITKHKILQLLIRNKNRWNVCKFARNIIRNVILNAVGVYATHCYKQGENYHRKLNR